MLHSPLAYLSFPNWIIGVLLAALGSFISNLGLNLQKLNHLNNYSKQHSDDNDNLVSDDFVLIDSNLPSYQNAQPTSITTIQVQPAAQSPLQTHDTPLHDDNEPDYTRQPLWQLGLALVILGSIADFVALVYAAQSIVAPLGSLTLVSNTLLAPLLLKETISKHDVASTLVIVAGSALAVSFASHTDRILTIDQLFHLFATNQFLIYILCVSAACLAMYQCTVHWSQMKQTSPQQYVKYIKYHRFMLAALSGVIGAQSVLLAKCTAQMIANTVSAKSILFLYWQCYVIIILMFTSIVTQIRILNSALQQFDALYIVPVFQSFWILMSVLSGMIFFQESDDVFYDAGRGTGFTFGVLFTIAGVYFLSQRETSVESGDVELTQYDTADAMTNMDTQSTHSQRSDRTHVGNMQCDLLLLPMLHKRHHRIFKSPPINSAYSRVQGGSGGGGSKMADTALMHPVDVQMMSTSAPTASPIKGATLRNTVVGRAYIEHDR